MKIDWRPLAIPQLIDSIHEIVQGHYTDVERAIMGCGVYRLHKDFEEYFVQPAVWCSKTDEQRRRHFDKIQRALKTTRSMSTSSNGDIIVLTSGARWKKIGQKKRVKATRAGRLRGSFNHHHHQVPDLEQTLAAMPLQTSLSSDNFKKFKPLLCPPVAEVQRLSRNVILCLPLSRLPSTFPVKDKNSKPLRLHTCP